MDSILGLLAMAPPEERPSVLRGLLAPSEPQPTGLLGAAYSNPLLMQQFAKQRAANPRPDVTDFMGYGPDWTTYLNNLNRNLNAQLPSMDDSPEIMAKKGVGLYGNFAPFGITAFHGSPHKFDKFDMSKVGTGEGAQAYGHGLYFAENPRVAAGYRKNLTVNDPTAANRAGLADEIGWLRQQEQVARSQGDHDLADRMLAKAIKADEQLQAMPVPGATYKVDIPDEQVAKMLDWDKPLSQQPESVRAAVKSLQERFGVSDRMLDPFAGREVTGGQLHQFFARRGSPEEVADVFRRHGIPGVRYLDQGSRTGGKGTSNFVVFDDQIPKILGRE